MSKKPRTRRPVVPAATPPTPTTAALSHSDLLRQYRTSFLKAYDALIVCHGVLALKSKDPKRPLKQAREPVAFHLEQALRAANMFQETLAMIELQLRLEEENSQ